MASVIPNCFVSAQTCIPAPPDLVAWYTGDDCSPSDILGSHDGAFAGLPVCSIDRKVGGGALSFSSAPPTFVQVPSAAGLNFGTGDFTIDFWIKTPGVVAGLAPILDKRTASPLVGYHVGLFNGYLLVQLADGAGSGFTNYFDTSDAGLFVADGQWRFVAISVQRSNPAGLVLQVDGYARSFNPTGRQGNLNNAADLLIGARHAALGGGALTGLMDEIEFFNRALSAAEIQSIYLAGGDGKCKACVPALPVCYDPIPGDPRPIWHELAPPDGSGYPDYLDVTENFRVADTIRLVASIATRAAQKLQDLSSQVEDLEAVGRCMCSLTEMHQDVARKDCEAGSPNLPCTSTPSGNYPLWLPTDLFKDTTATARFVLKYIGFLDKIKEILEEIQNNPGVSALATALAQLGTDLKDFADLIDRYAEYVKLLTEGYHLGGYSTQRPDLHLCVGYGGHGAFAEMANLLNGEVSIGGRYTSHNLSREHRSQFRSGGFAVRAFGKTLSILPGIEANLQIDGFKLWDAQKPFGIDVPAVGICPPPNCIPNVHACCDGCGFPLNLVDQVDIFHLVDSTEVAGFDSSGDGCLQPGEFIITDFYKATYLSDSDGQTHLWPRAAFEDCDWEKQNTAVFGAGLNLDLELEQIKKCGIPPHACPDAGITLFPGPPPAKLYVYFTLDAGAEWSYEANSLRDRLKDAVNKPLPTSLQLTADDFERPMHFLQAPDVSADDASSVFVKPRVAADLLWGIDLRSFLRLGIAVTIGVGVHVEPTAHGGVYDFNVALATALLNSNPPQDLPCDPIVEATQTMRCSNTLLIDPDTSEPLSSAAYSCDTNNVVVYHCKEPENETSCEPESAEEDCPETGECVPEYGCHAYGYCTRTTAHGEVVQYDTTEAACRGEAVCLAPALNAGKPCEENADCPGPRQCNGGPLNGNPCNTNADCREATCQTTTAPCEAKSAGYFTPYQCLISAIPEITGWQGPGCHPLTVGFPSACGCAADADCVAGLENCMSGSCHALSNGQPVPCDCDPGNSVCTSGRTCVDGGCLKNCTTNADCPANLVCTNGSCVNPYGILFAEQIVWWMTHTPIPQHAVGTYALSDIMVSAFLDLGLWIGLDLKIFKKVRRFDLVKITRYWPIGNPLNKSWFQAGLEARYQHDCDIQTANAVTNWQPGAQTVHRYPTTLPGSASFGNAGTETQLLQWCETELPQNVADPNAPGVDDLVNSITDLVEWGEDIGFEIWGLAGMCVTMQIGDELVSQPFTDWIANLNNLSSTLTCEYTFNNQTHVFPCSQLGNRLLLIWGCLDVAANPHAAALAAHFNGVNNPLNIVTTFNGSPVIDLNTVLINPANEFELANVKPQILNYGGFQGVLWYAAVSQCWDAHYAQVQSGDVQLLGVDFGPCCGNGILDISGCDQPTGSPCEQCDDGNSLPGDGCSPLCRIEGRPNPIRCGDGIVQTGLGEECDGSDASACPGHCRADCTCPPATCSPKYDGSGCQLAACADLNVCRPAHLVYHPGTGKIIVARCICDASTCSPSCDDGLLCNGIESCIPGTNQCSPGTPPCPAGTTCRESSRSCVRLAADTLAEFVACLTGPAAASPSGCAAFDLVEDGRNDLRDFAFFQREFQE